MFKRKEGCEDLALRLVWMLLFGVVGHLAQMLLFLVVVAQLFFRVVNGQPSHPLQAFGDSLAQFFAQIVAFLTFHSEQKPWPFIDWPAARASVRGH